jgi:hypothetical protein
MTAGWRLAQSATMRLSAIQVHFLGSEFLAMLYRTIKGLAHDPKLAAALGDMIVAWAYAETILMNTLTRVLISTKFKLDIIASPPLNRA